MHLTANRWEARLTTMHNTTSKTMVWLAVLIITSAAFIVFGPLVGILAGGGSLWWALNQ
jgi:hypothetical protein